MSDRQLQTSCISLHLSHFCLSLFLSLSHFLHLPSLFLYFPLSLHCCSFLLSSHLVLVHLPLPPSFSSLSPQLSNSVSPPSPSQSGSQLSDMAVNRITLTQSEFSMRGTSLQTNCWLLVSSCFGETDWQIDERQRGLNFSLFTDSLCSALIGQDVV